MLVTPVSRCQDYEWRRLYDGIRMNRMTVALVLPPQVGLLEGFGGGPIALANYVRAATSADVQILDLSLSSRDSVVREVENFSRSIGDRLFVGISTTTASYQSALRVARAFKRSRPDCTTVLGGHHAGPEADNVLRRHREIDVVVVGEGEVALATLVKCYPRLDDVPNLVFRSGDRHIRNAEAPLLSQHDLDQISPFFADDVFRCAPGKFEHATYVSARGCPLSCAFCAVANQAIRQKSVPAVVADLRNFVRAGFQQIAIEDNFFAHSPRRTLELCSALEQLRREVQFTWDCQTRVESLRRLDVVHAMAAAGCEAVYIGVEAVDPDHLIYLGKTRNPAAYVQTLDHDVLPTLFNLGIAPYLNLQLGLPGESTKHRDSTLSALSVMGRRAIDAGSSITVYPQLHVVYPGTRHWRSLRSPSGYGAGVRADLFEEFTAWEDEEPIVVQWLSKHFAHGTGGIPIGLLDERALRAKDLEPQDRFRVEPRSVFAIDEYLDQIAAISGINLFRYSQFIAKPAAERSENADALRTR